VKNDTVVQRQRKNEKVCFIGGAGHSGSTLVGLVLGSHGQCFYAGEAAKTRFIGNNSKPLRKRVCKICGTNCPVWGGFRLADDVDLYEQISRRTQRPVIVDSTKNVDWLSQQVSRLEGTSAQSYFLFLQRDGRAVINSRVRKYPDRAARSQIEGWLTQLRRTKALYDSLACPKMTVRYEMFATRPAKVTQDLCQFLGLDYDERLLEFDGHDHHPLGGNNGTQYQVARRQGRTAQGPCTVMDGRHQDYYANHGPGIRLDLRWRDELDPEILSLFNAIGGEDNEPMRWEIDT
jgi:hypothetical protein